MKNNTYNITRNIEFVINSYKTDNYHLSIYNDEKDTSVDCIVDAEKLREFGNFILKYLGDK